MSTPRENMRLICRFKELGNCYGWYFCHAICLNSAQATMDKGTCYFPISANRLGGSLRAALVFLYIENCSQARDQI